MHTAARLNLILAIFFIIRQVASHVKYNGRFKKAIGEFPMVINVNSCSVTHRFRIISDLSDFLTGSDVTPISPLGGVVSQVY